MSFRFSLQGAASKVAPRGAKARAEQDAKDREEEAARKRLHEEFLDEHGLSDDDTATSAKAARTEQEHIFVPTGSRRQFSTRARSGKSGPGTLEAFEPYATSSNAPPPARAFGQVDTSRDRENNVHARVYAKASNLPPGTGLDTIKGIFAGFKNLKVVSVEEIREPQGRYERTALALKVAFEPSAEFRDLNVAIPELNDKTYMGCGYYLHLDRYLGDNQTSGSKKLPYGAVWEEPEEPSQFAPTEELGGSARKPQDTSLRLVVTAYPPRHLPTLRLIHMIIEGVLKGGKEFEAALMEMESIQKDERFAWLYDDKHPLNRYYRFRIHQLATGDHRETIEIFPGFGEWRGGPPLPYEFANETDLTLLCEALIQSDTHDSFISALKGQGDITTGDRQFAGQYPAMPEPTYGIISPKERLAFKACLVQVGYEGVMGVVQSTSDDIAAPTRFMIDHESSGMDELIDMVIDNIFEPYILQPYNYRYNEIMARNPSLNALRKNAIVNALRVAADVAEVVTGRLKKNLPYLKGKCYMYRAKIGSQLVARNVFGWLVDVPERYGMGRVTSAQFVDDINYSIGFWKEQALFDPGVVESFKTSFTLKRQEKEEERKRKANPQRAAEEERKRQEGEQRRMPVPQRRTLDRYPQLGKSISNGGADEGESRHTDDDVPELKRKNFLDSTNWNGLQETTSTQPARLDTIGQSQPCKSKQAMELETERTASTATEKASNASNGRISARETKKTSPMESEGPKNQRSLGRNPSETAAARARRMRPKAEDMFASDED